LPINLQINGQSISPATYPWKAIPRAGIGAFAFSTIVITLLGGNYSATYFPRNALPMAAQFTPLLNVYREGFFPIAKPTAIVLN
jgi:metal transporter CNNM